MRCVDLLATRWHAIQSPICESRAVEFFEFEPALNTGVSDNLLGGRFVTDGIWPLHGLRHLPAPTTTGWYIWAGDLSEEPDFFKPVHSAHLDTWCSDAIPFLGLPPGWRFLLAPNHQDVWYDDALLVV